MGTVLPSLDYKYVQHLAVCFNTIFTSLHGPAGACILVTSASPILTQVQCAHILYNIITVNFT